MNKDIIFNQLDDSGRIHGPWRWSFDSNIHKGVKYYFIGFNRHGRKIGLWYKGDYGD